MVRDRPTTYDNLYQIYGSRNVGRQYTNGRADTFQHQLVSSILCQPGYQTMPSPTKHVVVGGSSMQAPMQVSYLFFFHLLDFFKTYFSFKYVNVPVPVSMVEPSSSQRMLLTNRVQANGMAWPQSGRQVALVPSWQPPAPHSLIVDSAPFLNMDDIYPKHHLPLPRHEPKKDSPIHHLV